MKAPRIRLKTIQLETDAGARTQQQELRSERQRRKYSEAVKAPFEKTAQTSSLGVVSLCTRNRGSFSSL